MNFMIDTNILIEILRCKKRELVEFVYDMGEDCCISSITYAELCHGVQASTDVMKNSEALGNLLSLIRVEPFGFLAAQEYGRILNHLISTGDPIGIMDTLIASHARALNYTLVTHNVHEFEKVPGLIVEDWVQRFM